MINALKNKITNTHPQILVKRAFIPRSYAVYIFKVQWVIQDCNVRIDIGNTNRPSSGNSSFCCCSSSVSYKPVHFDERIQLSSCCLCCEQLYKDLSSAASWRTVTRRCVTIFYCFFDILNKISVRRRSRSSYERYKTCFTINATTTLLTLFFLCIVFYTKQRFLRIMCSSTILYSGGTSKNNECNCFETCNNCYGHLQNNYIVIHLHIMFLSKHIYRYNRCISLIACLYITSLCKFYLDIKVVKRQKSCA